MVKKENNLRESSNERQTNIIIKVVSDKNSVSYEKDRCGI